MEADARDGPIMNYESLYLIAEAARNQAERYYNHKRLAQSLQQELQMHLDEAAADREKFENYMETLMKFAPEMAEPIHAKWNERHAS